MKDVAKSLVQAEAKRISNEAREANAGRVCFKIGKSAIFSDTDKTSITTALESSNVTKYKLQRAIGGSWKDVDGYVDVFPVDALLKALRANQLDDAPQHEKANLVEASTRRPEQVSHAIAHMHRRAIDSFMRKPNRGEIQRAIVDTEFLADVDMPLRDYAEANLRLHGVIADVLSQDDPNVAASLKSIDDFARTGHASLHTESGQIALNVMRGKLISLEDREHAGELFAAAVDNDQHDVLRTAFLDIGAWTYFAAGQPPEIFRQASDLARQSRDSIKWLNGSSPRSPMAIAVSVDPVFLRIYGHSILWLAQQLPEIDFAIIICGSDGINEVISDAASFQSGLNVLNQSGEPRNVRYLNMPEPEGVVEDSTFFASARFFAIDALLEEYPNVYIMDADLVADSDPRPFFKKISSWGFSAPKTRGFAAISPWRRFMAGNVAVNRRALASPIVKELQDYLAMGLVRPNSWMLDQNALAFAIERNFDAYSDLNQMPRPFSQPAFRAVAEKSFKVATKLKR